VFSSLSAWIGDADEPTLSTFIEHRAAVPNAITFRVREYFCLQKARAMAGRINHLVVQYRTEFAGTLDVARYCPNIKYVTFSYCHDSVGLWGNGQELLTLPKLEAIYISTDNMGPDARIIRADSPRMGDWKVVPGSIFTMLDVPVVMSAKTYKFLRKRVPWFNGMPDFIV
jgi:hypothetical protein